MGPFGSIGPYTEATITTRKSDGAAPTDKQPHFGHFVIGLLFLGPALWVVGFMGLFVWSYIGLLLPAGIIGLAIWACGYYGTNDSLWRRFTYRTTAAHRAIIRQRLSDTKKF